MGLFASIMELNITGIIIFNTFAVSIPEAIFLLLFVRFLMRSIGSTNDNKIDWTRIDKRIEICSFLLLYGFTTNILRYTKIDIIVVLITSITVTLIACTFIYKLWRNKSSISKVFLILLIGFFVIFIIEFSYIPAILFITGLEISSINSNVILNFIISLPERAIEFLVISFIISRRIAVLNNNILRPILASKFLTILTTSIILFNIMFIGLMVKLIGYDKILLNCDSQSKLLVTVFTFLFPLLNICALLFSIYFHDNRSKKEILEATEVVDIFLKEIKNCINEEKYDKIPLTIDAIKLEVESLNCKG